jgi:hypothetical protein
MPTPTDINGSDPIEHLHVIVEEWLYGNVQGWLNSTDIVHLENTAPSCAMDTPLLQPHCRPA